MCLIFGIFTCLFRSYNSLSFRSTALYKRLLVLLLHIIFKLLHAFYKLLPVFRLVTIVEHCKGKQVCRYIFCTRRISGRNNGFGYFGKKSLLLLINRYIVVERYLFIAFARRQQSNT